MAATGDLMFNRPLVRADLNERTSRVYDLLRQADITFANLEIPLTDRGVSADKLVTFRADPALAGDLRKIGIDVVTFANNHGLDFGVEGLVQTLESLDAVAMPRVGAGRDAEEAYRPAFLSDAGLRVAFVGLASTLPAGSAARNGRPGIAPIRVFTKYVIDSEALDEQPGTAPYVETEAMASDIDAACEAVRQAAQAADVVVVGIHWGVPHGWVAAFQDPLATYQRPLAHRLIDAGATAIVGNHAHVLHGIEYYKERPILYCLGNFLFHRLASGTPLALNRNYPPYSWRSLRSPVNRLSAVATLTLGLGGVSQVQLTPIEINDLGEPELVTGEKAEQILAMLDDLSRPLGVSIRQESGIGYAEPERGR